MARTAQLRAGETIEQLARRMGVTLEELYALNPGLTKEQIVEGFSFNLPEAVATSTPVAEPRPGETSNVPGVTTPPATDGAVSAAPTGEMTLDQGGLFQEMLKNFTQAFQTFVSAPAFLRDYDTASRGAQMGRSASGFSRQEAGFLREIEPELYSRYGEAVQREFALTGKIPTLTAGDFLKGINVKEEMEMTQPGSYRGQRRQGPPAIAPRRLRF